MLIDNQILSTNSLRVSLTYESAVKLTSLGSTQISTVKPLLSGPPIKWTPSVKRTVSQVPKLMSYIFPFITNPYSADTSIKQMWTLK